MRQTERGDFYVSTRDASVERRFCNIPQRTTVESLHHSLHGRCTKQRGANLERVIHPRILASRREARRRLTIATEHQVFVWSAGTRNHPDGSDDNTSDFESDDDNDGLQDV